MATSYNRDILFIHIPKCAGLAVTDYLKATLPCVRTTQYRHVSVRLAQKFTGKPASEYKATVAVIRNPYDQQVSQYEFWRQEFKSGKQGPHFDFANASSFAEFIRSPMSNFAVDETWKETGGVYGAWLIDEANEFPNNLKVVKLEEMNSLKETLAPYSIVDAKIPHTNKSNNRKAYADYYTDSDRLVVQEKFAWAFDNHYTR